MSPEEKPGLDPRFDPVFQRGYDPEVHEVHAQPRRTSARPDSIGQPPTARNAGPEPADIPVEELQEAEPDVPNPWRRALLLTSVGLLLAAFVFVWMVGQRDIYSTPGIPDVAELFLQQLSYQLPTPLLVGGVLGLLTWVALGAIRRRQ